VASESLASVGRAIAMREALAFGDTRLLIWTPLYGYATALASTTLSLAAHLTTATQVNEEFAACVL